MVEGLALWGECAVAAEADGAVPMFDTDGEVANGVPRGREGERELVELDGASGGGLYVFEGEGSFAVAAGVCEFEELLQTAPDIGLGDDGERLGTRLIAHAGEDGGNSEEMIGVCMCEIERIDAGGAPPELRGHGEAAIEEEVGIRLDEDRSIGEAFVECFSGAEDEGFHGGKSSEPQAALAWRTGGALRPQQRLYFSPLPQGHGALRGVWLDGGCELVSDSVQ